MELGCHLVHELGFGDSVDTLGRWMAHHVAELIDTAKNGKTEDKRLRSREQATEIILELWKHRASLPGNAWPLAPYKDVLRVIDLMGHGRESFFHLAYDTNKDKDWLAARIFEQLTRLITTVLLMHFHAKKKPIDLNTSAVKALDASERKILEYLRQLVTFFSDDSRASERMQGEDHGTAKLHLEETAIELIDEIRGDLTELQNMLGNDMHSNSDFSLGASTEETPAP